LSGGLTVDIETPDFELRTAIALIKAKKHGVDLSIDVAKSVAEAIQDSRGLEGTLLRLITEANSFGEDMTVDLVERVLSKKENGPLNTSHPDEIVKNICQFYGLKPTQLKGERRNSSLVKARQVAMYILKKDLGLSFVEIGNILGGRDHTTIMHGVNKIEGLLTKTKINEEILGISNFTRGKTVDY